MHRGKLDNYDREILLGLMRGERSNTIARKLGFAAPSISYRLEQIQYLCKAKTTIEAIAIITLGAKTLEEAVDRFINTGGKP